MNSINAVADIENTTDADRLAALVHPLSVDEFLGGIWPGEFRHFRGDPARLAELIGQPTFRDVESLVKCPLQGSLRADYTREDRPSEMDITPERAVQLYDAACTIYMTRLHSDPIRRWAASLDKTLGLLPGTTQVNAFASSPGRGLSWHWDSQEIFVVQVRGRKRWYVAPNEHVEWPTLSGQAGAEERPEIRFQMKDPNRPITAPEEWQTEDLSEGSVLFLPRGYWHTTENIDESIHLVLQMKMPCWRDVFGFLLQSVPQLYDSDWRKPTRALQPENLFGAGISEFQDRCATLSSFASADGMASLARMFGDLRS